MATASGAVSVPHHRNGKRETKKKKKTKAPGEAKVSRPRSAGGGLGRGSSSLQRQRERLAPVLPPATWLALGRRLRLSPQQTEILRLIVEDNDPPTAALAHTLGVSPSSISTQLERIYAKMPPPRVRSRAALVARALREYVGMAGAKEAE